MGLRGARGREAAMDEQRRQKDEDAAGDARARTVRASPIAFPFDNSYARLPAHFFARLEPTPVARPRLLKLNRALGETLGLDVAALDSEEGAAIFAGNALPQGAEPLAQAYAGHQFGGFVPQLGDGRALLLGEVIDRHGVRRDVQLKGSGPTPFSRRGDGRAALGPVLREYLVSEAMTALGVPTTRMLAATATGEPVYREEVLPGAIVTRTAASHLRVGTFQYFAARGDGQAVKSLADYAIARHYPAAADAPNPYRALLDAVVGAQARLIAKWMQVGFIHGVMNTDNCSIAGETIDYGPCAFMDAYDPATVFSSIDAYGRYAYANQPKIAQWNGARFAETLLPLLHENAQEAVESAQEAVESFADVYGEAMIAGLRKKLGLFTPREEDGALAEEFFACLHESRADFTLAFRMLGRAAAGEELKLKARFDRPARLEAWLPRWRARIAQEPQSAEERAAMMDAANPLFIPRNHQVEAALTAAVESDDLAPFETLLGVVTKPFDEQPGNEAYAEPPAPGGPRYRTFCGT
jgi:uncharacterized protein YdiU (UPF0061 family)